MPGGDVDVVSDAHRPRLADRPQVSDRRAGLRRAVLSARQRRARLHRRRARRRAPICRRRPIALNRSLADRILHAAAARASSRDVTVAVLGLAYKPFSHVIEESQAIMMVKAFLEHGARVLAYDPLAGRSAESGARRPGADHGQRARLPARRRRGADRDARSRVQGADGRAISGATAAPCVVVDFWRILSDELSPAPPGIEYVPYGRGPRRRAGGPTCSNSSGERHADTLWTLTSRSPTCRSTRSAPSGTRGPATSATRRSRSARASTSTRSSAASTSSSRTFPAFADFARWAGQARAGDRLRPRHRHGQLRPRRRAGDRGRSVGCSRRRSRASALEVYGLATA